MCANFFRHLIAGLPPEKGGRSGTRVGGMIGGAVVDVGSCAEAPESNCHAPPSDSHMKEGSIFSADHSSDGILLAQEPEWKGVCVEVNEDDAYSYVLREVL